MSAVIVVAEIDLVAGQEDEALAALTTLCEATHAVDPGCELYALHRVAGDPAKTVMVEKWETAEALKAHGGSDHIKALAAAPGLIWPPKVTVLEPLGVGDGEKGAL